MRIPKKDTQEQVSGSPTWTFEGFKGGGSAIGWVYGEQLWMDCHHRFVSQPCWTVLTGGKLTCPHCGVWRDPKETGYIAWVGESGKPMCSAVQPYAKAVLKKLGQGAPVKVSKGGNKHSPVTFAASRGTDERYVPPRGQERTGEQFDHWLLRFMKVGHELLAYFGADQACVVAAPAAPVVVADDADTKKLRELMARDRKPTHDPASIESLVDYVQTGGRESGLYVPGSNGTPRKK